MRYFEVPAERRGKRQLTLRDAQPHMLYHNRQVVFIQFSPFDKRWLRELRQACGRGAR